MPPRRPISMLEMREIRRRHVEAARLSRMRVSRRADKYALTSYAMLNAAHRSAEEAIDDDEVMLKASKYRGHHSLICGQQPSFLAP